MEMPGLPCGKWEIRTRIIIQLTWMVEKPRMMM